MRMKINKNCDKNSDKTSDINNDDRIKKPLMLYVHIPFCVKKCAYCDFLSGPANVEEIDAYVTALCREIDWYREVAVQYEVDSIFFGGGTPSILNENRITQVMTRIRDVFYIKDEAEITIECNPGTVSKSKLECYKRLGINRISFGLQSTDNQELEHLGRIHTYETFLENYALARELGFHNINIDLMSALPGQTIESYCETLNKIIALDPEHISAYSLILEEGTPFYEMYGEDGKYQEMIPGEEADRQMYHETKRMLQEASYERYEISNYAKQGYACRHNVGYWRRREYLGIGLGSSSFINKERFHNTDDMEKYINVCGEGRLSSEIVAYDVRNNADNAGNNIGNNVGNIAGSENADNNANCNETPKDIPNDLPKDISFDSRIEKTRTNLDMLREERQKLSQEEAMEEFMFLGLRLSNGIQLQEFQEEFSTSIYEVYEEVINKLEQENLIVIHEGRMYLTELGTDVSNHVFAEFLLNDRD